LLAKALIALSLLLAGFPVIVLAEDKVLEVIEVKYEDPIRDYAYWEVVENWNEAEWKAFNLIITKESNWNPNAQNPNSTAFGLGQFLNSTWAGVGCVKTNDPEKQIDCTIKYIEDRYETPSKALSFHLANNWY
jgi:hypothetical protein